MRRDDILNLLKVCSPTNLVVKNEAEFEKSRTKSYFFSSDEQLVGSSKSDTITETEDWTCEAVDPAVLQQQFELFLVSKVYEPDGQHQLRSQRARKTIFLLFNRDSDNCENQTPGRTINSNDSVFPSRSIYSNLIK